MKKKRKREREKFINVFKNQQPDTFLSSISPAYFILMYIRGSQEKTFTGKNAAEGNATKRQKFCDISTKKSRFSMVIILDGNSEICAHVKSVSLLFDLFKAFDQFESSHKSDSFLSEILLHMCATCSELPSNINATRFSFISFFFRSFRKT